MASEPWVITCSFNPSRYQTKGGNYERFAAGLDDVGAIAWLNCDLSFEDPSWFGGRAAASEDVLVLPRFETAVRLLPEQIRFCGQGECYAGFGLLHNSPRESLATKDFERNAHTDFTWVKRRAWMEDVGLYDTCLAANGDHLMAHALAGDMGSPCVDGAFGRASRSRNHFELWADDVYRLARGQIGFVPGRLLHGSGLNRQYSWQDQVFQTFDSKGHLSRKGGWGLEEQQACHARLGSRFLDLRLEDATAPWSD